MARATEDYFFAAPMIFDTRRKNAAGRRRISLYRIFQNGIYRFYRKVIRGDGIIVVAQRFGMYRWQYNRAPYVFEKDIKVYYPGTWAGTQDGDIYAFCRMTLLFRLHSGIKTEPASSIAPHCHQEIELER